jgi:hypothetical protein
VSVGTGAESWLRARRQILVWALGSRVVVFFCAFLGAQLHWPRGFFGLHEFAHRLAFLESWDGGWYRRVAAQGYLLVPGRQSDPAFFPLFPILLRALHAMGFSYFTSGVLLANLAFLVAVLAFYELGRELLPEQDARRAAVYASVFPMGFVFSMGYPESLVFAAIALAASFALRGRWIAAAAAGGIAALARPEGLLFVLPLTALVLRRWHELSRADRGRALAAVLAPAVTLLTYPLYLSWSVHNVYAWAWAERGWGRSFKPTGLITAFLDLPPAVGQHPWLVRDVVFVVLYTLLLAVAWRAGVPAMWILAGALIVFIPLWSGSFTSEARFGLIALPAYWGMAVLGRLRVVGLALPAVCLLLLAAGTLTLPLAFP